MSTITLTIQKESETLEVSSDIKFRVSEKDKRKRNKIIIKKLLELIKEIDEPFV